ncbi:MAG: hypothetical protein AB8U25_02955 [Rickettsiales endosymbiont of Dermacentor nuttalli]
MVNPNILIDEKALAQANYYANSGKEIYQTLNSYIRQGEVSEIIYIFNTGRLEQFSYMSTKLITNIVSSFAVALFI